VTGRAKRLTQQTRRQESRPLHIGSVDDQQIDVSRQHQMLKSIVKNVDRGAQVQFGDTTGEEAIGRDDHGDVRQRARQHQWLVAGATEIGTEARPVAHDGDPVVRCRARVAAAQDRGPMAGLEQPARNKRRQRRLAAPARRKAADADDGAIEPPDS